MTNTGPGKTTLPRLVVGLPAPSTGTMAVLVPAYLRRPSGSGAATTPGVPA
ncbi:hypothetical protein [Micromonospora sp. WMMD708]|uniref:hypothetical protein n=1 Tax=Micromonospora sp. WMMD708 TaxID=3403464 RepID=UPI003BF507C2